ncbi:HAD-IA family hydrolase [Winogradskyella sp. 3972H.M.0a.05]|uniref:HAD family hydrolase n=1 Tax=Winogradskyella sp. 3972H.M.0a.05 TaxID=2950277 RepID=UPI003399C535
MSKYKAVIFDCDGVLVDSELIGNGVLVDLANTYGANITLEYALKHFKGNSMRVCYDKISELATEKLPDDFVDMYREKSFEAFKSDIKPIKGVENVLNNLDLPYCVASSGPENKIRLNLELTGLLPYFEGKIFSCYAIQKWKPDPSIFLLAAEAMNVSPKDCLVIEDSLLGIEAANRGGFDVFAYTEHDYNDELSEKSTADFDNMADLVKMIYI